MRQMKISELINKQEIKLATKADFIDKKITGCYICDLLSHVMGRVKPGDAWVTVQTNINIIAVAALTDAACIIIPDGLRAGDEIAAKADEKGIVILYTNLDSFSLSMQLSKLL